MKKKADNDTKAKIIEAAYKVLGEQGYDKASMKEIAREAGVAQGLINYYFPSKEELLFALFEEETCRYCAEMAKVSDMPLTDNYIRDAMRLSMELVEDYPQWHRLRYELFAIGLRTAAGRKEIARSMEAGREIGVAAINRFPLVPNMNKEAIATVIVATLDGLALHKMADEQYDAAAAYDTLAHILEVYLAAHMARK